MDVLKGAQMARRKNYTPEEIVTKLRQVEVATAKGQAVALACKAAGITEQTYYRWRPCLSERHRGGDDIKVVVQFAEA
jgi:transposase-like protein